jgi:hypothetical protein
MKKRALVAWALFVALAAAAGCGTTAAVDETSAMRTSPPEASEKGVVEISGKSALGAGGKSMGGAGGTTCRSASGMGGCE